VIFLEALTSTENYLIHEIWENMILITGANGYIGRHLAHHLGDQNVVLTDLHESFFYQSRRNYNYRKADLTNILEVEELFKEFQINGIIHLAGLKSVPNSFKDPERYLTVNFRATTQLVEIGHTFGLKRFLFASTAAVYGSSPNASLVESQDCHPNSPYGETKLLSEKWIDVAGRSHGFSTASLRFFNIGGSKDRILKDSATDNVIPIFHAAASQNRALRIFGNAYDTPDGTAIRDYLHILDLCKYIEIVFDQLNFDEPLNLILNAGSGIGSSVLEIAKFVIEFHNSQSEISIESARNGDVPIAIAHTVAQSNFQMFPTRTISDIIESSW
jgi:UDP-glucose 4-epimerase